MQTSMVSTSERPDLVPLVAEWLWNAFGRPEGGSFEQTLDEVRTSVSAPLMPRTFVLLADGEPVGTASLAAADLTERPDLTPWLAGVFVAPEARGQGYAARLVAAVEQEARAASVQTLWLYTHSAERIYARVGWETVEIVQHNGRSFALMRRDLLRQP